MGLDVYTRSRNNSTVSLGFKTHSRGCKTDVGPWPLLEDVEKSPTQISLETTSCCIPSQDRQEVNGTNWSKKENTEHTNQRPVTALEIS